MVPAGSENSSGGRPKLPKGFIDKVKRERCFVAIAELVGEQGPYAATTAAITSRVRISRATFYGLFESREAAIRQACEYSRETLLAALTEAPLSGSWEQRLRQTVGGLTDVVERNPDLAELCLVQARSMLSDADVPYDREVVTALAERLNDILGAATGRSDFDFGELWSFGILSVIAQHLLEARGLGIGEIRDELSDIVGSAYRDV